MRLHQFRRTHGVALTDAGQRLLARARVIARQVTLSREDLRQAGGSDAGTLRGGLTPFLNFTALARPSAGSASAAATWRCNCSKAG